MHGVMHIEPNLVCYWLPEMDVEIHSVVLKFRISDVETLGGHFGLQIVIFVLDSLLEEKIGLDVNQKDT